MPEGKLHQYQTRRRFTKTPEPQGKTRRTHSSQPIFVVQAHDATRLHYDVRLESDGVLKSWAVPKGPSLNPQEKRLAIPTEDHPMEYATFEGVIPEGQYGAGPVIVWDTGALENRTLYNSKPLTLSKAIKRGHAVFLLHGEKLKGLFALTRTSTGKKPMWILVKMRDAFARGGDIIREKPESVLSGRTLAAIRKSA